MVEVIRPSNITSETHEGIKQYYIQKIEELQVRWRENDEKMMVWFFLKLNVAEKSQNLRRLQAKRNELNAKGNIRRRDDGRFVFD